jgi:hypothetical protein
LGADDERPRAGSPNVKILSDHDRVARYKASADLEPQFLTP